MYNYDVQVLPRSREWIRELATLVREVTVATRGEFGPRFPIVEALEEVMPELDTAFVYEILDKHEMGENHGLTLPSEHLIQIRLDVYEGACAGNGRDRMTVAHEIGHYLMHDTPRFARNTKNTRVPAYCNPEWQADCFGGELLVFPEGLSADMTAEQVAKLRGVSLDAARIQLTVLRNGGIIR